MNLDYSQADNLQADPFQSDQATTATCELSHRLFTQLGEPIFRRAATDATPVMAVRLGERDAAIPLRSLQKECGIRDDSPDGRMLQLIAESLDFVTGLRLGDTLPTEVLTGEASWEPEPAHLKLAATRLHMQLVEWLGSRSGPGSASEKPALDARALVGSEANPALRQQVQTAFDQAALALGLRDASEVVTLVENLARELAYIEALRDRLLRPVQDVAMKLRASDARARGSPERQETLTQVRRLAGRALKQIGGRFDELDAQTGEVMHALRNAESQRAFIRSSRDWLYRSQLAWDPLLRAWDKTPGIHHIAFPALLNRSYLFLAPRFMAVTEWTTFSRQQDRKKEETHMVW